MSRALRIALLAAPSLLFLALLAAAEAALRSGPRVDPLEFLVRDPHQGDDLRDDREVSIFEADPLIFWRLRPDLHEVIWDFTVVSTNAQGLRYPRPVGPPAPGVRRVLCLGDSVTFGYRVPVVFPERPESYDADAAPYPALLEAHLRAANPGTEIEVIPLAVPGHSSHQGRLWLERAIGWLQPELVTASFGWNDATLAARDDRAAMPGGAARVAARRLVLGSQLLMRASLLLPAPRAAPASRWEPRVDRESYVANHLAMAERARRAGARFAAIAPVLRDPTQLPEAALRVGALRDALREAMRRADLPLVERTELTEAGWPANAALFGETIHPTAAGHRVIADALLALLSERSDLLPGLRTPAPAPPAPPSSR